jgi:hypothetical protein
MGSAMVPAAAEMQICEILISAATVATERPRIDGSAVVIMS